MGEVPGPTQSKRESSRREVHQASMRYEMGLNLLPGHSYGEHDSIPSHHGEIEGEVIAEIWLTDDARVEIRPPSDTLLSSKAE